MVEVCVNDRLASLTRSPCENDGDEEITQSKKLVHLGTLSSRWAVERGGCDHWTRRQNREWHMLDRDWRLRGSSEDRELRQLAFIIGTFPQTTLEAADDLLPVLQTDVPKTGTLFVTIAEIGILWLWTRGHHVFQYEKMVTKRLNPFWYTFWYNCATSLHAS